MFTRGLTLVNQLCYIKCFLQAPVLCTGTQVQHSWPKNKHKEPTPLSRRTKKTQRLCSTCWEDRVKGNGHSRCADHRHEEDKGVCRRQTDTCRDRGSCIRQRYHMKLNEFDRVPLPPKLKASAAGQLWPSQLTPTQSKPHKHSGQQG